MTRHRQKLTKTFDFVARHDFAAALRAYCAVYKDLSFGNAYLGFAACHTESGQL